MSEPFAVRYEDVESAAARLDGVANRTPVVTSRSLDARLGARVFLKCENVQRMGAFKFRGAYNAVSRLSEAERARGVLSFSSGNHAQAIALASRLLGTRATVVMPDDAPAVKRRAAEAYGARIVSYDPERQDREAVAREIAEREQPVLIPPYDHPDVVAGQGTAARELIQETGPLDLLLAPCGGGGLLSGCAIAMKRLSSGGRVVGVEPDTADDATRSFRTGVLHTVKNPPTVADGVRTPSLGRITFPIVRSLVDDMVTVPDAVILQAMRFLWERLKLVVEPTGALALAALWCGRVETRGAKIGVLVSGGNVDLAAALELLRGLPPED